MTLIELESDFEIIARVLFAFVLGGLIGWERERHGGISAGIRTYGAISLGSCVFGILSLSIVGADPSRIAAQITTGVGFLCGGVIFREAKYIGGLTTAATLWATAAVGLSVSFGFYVVGIVTAVLIYLLLYLPRLEWWKKVTGRKQTDKT